ncbi:MAG: hypothetical protein ACLTXH_09030 [Enterobacter hormaechei]
MHVWSAPFEYHPSPLGSEIAK